MCRCLQALAEALKINASITKIVLYWNDIGAEGAKAWCGVGCAEHSLSAAVCHDVMSSTSCDNDLDGLEVLQFHRLTLIESCPTCIVAAVQGLL